MLIFNKDLNFDSIFYQEFLMLLATSGKESRIIGGAVRDALLNKLNKDIDIATTILPYELINIFNHFNIRILLHNIKYGHIIAFYKKEKFEITTLREDIICNGRHAEIKFTDSFLKDALRRDFTFNALSYCPFQKKVFDYFSGFHDLVTKKVLFIGNPLLRIREDFLRILRFFRFTCYIDAYFDKNSLRAICMHKKNIGKLSKERIKIEIDKLLYCDSYIYALNTMNHFNILEQIFFSDKFSITALYFALNFEYVINHKIDYIVQYSLIFAYKRGCTLQDLLDFKFSNKQSKKIFKYIEFIYYTTSISIDELYVIFKKIWLESSEKHFLDYMIIYLSFHQNYVDEILEFILRYNNSIKPHFNIQVQDIIDIGIKKKDLRNSISFLKNHWIKNNFILNKHELLQILKNESL